MAGVNRIILGELTVKKKKGKELSKAIGQEFSPEAIMRKNNEIKPKRGPGR